MQKNDLRIEREPDIADVRALALTLRKRYLLTYPVESVERMLNKGFNIIITDNSITTNCEY